MKTFLVAVGELVGILIVAAVVVAIFVGCVLAGVLFVNSFL